jgi:hypothetical protein
LDEIVLYLQGVILYPVADRFAKSDPEPPYIDTEELRHNGHTIEDPTEIQVRRAGGWAVYRILLTSYFQILVVKQK